MRKLFYVLLLAFTLSAVTGFANLTQIEQDVGKNANVKTEISIAQMQVNDFVDVDAYLKNGTTNHIYLQKTISGTPATFTATIPSFKNGNQTDANTYNKSKADQTFRTKIDYTIYNEWYRTNYNDLLKVNSVCQYSYKKARDGLIRGEQI